MIEAGCCAQLIGQSDRIRIIIEPEIGQHSEHIGIILEILDFNRDGQRSGRIDGGEAVPKIGET